MRWVQSLQSLSSIALLLTLLQYWYNTVKTLLQKLISQHISKYLEILFTLSIDIVGIMVLLTSLTLLRLSIDIVEAI